MYNTKKKYYAFVQVDLVTRRAGITRKSFASNEIVSKGTYDAVILLLLFRFSIEMWKLTLFF